MINTKEMNTQELIKAGEHEIEMIKYLENTITQETMNGADVTALNNEVAIRKSVIAEIKAELDVRAKADMEIYDDEEVEVEEVEETSADKFVRTHEIKEIIGNDYLRRVSDKFMKLLDKEGNSMRLAVTLHMKNGDEVLVSRSGDYSYRDCSGDRFSIKVNDEKFSKRMSYKEMINFIGYYGK